MSSKNVYLVTGATGLIGSAITKKLLSEGNQVVALVRNTAGASQFSEYADNLTIVEQDITSPISYTGDVNFIIHTAAPTDSAFFIDHPVETITSIVDGTKNILDFAKQKDIESLVFLSSMEVYGISNTDEDITEEKQFYCDPLAVRSDYPLAKRLAENLCIAYLQEHGVPVKIARLAQVIGRSLSPNDNRIIAKLIRSALSQTDIVLRPSGKTMQTYIHIDDAVSGIMSILKDGKDGEAYNIANESTYTSIRDLAELVASEIADGKIVVTAIDEDDAKYPPDRKLNINSAKLQGLGWQPTISLTQALQLLADNHEQK